MGQPEVVPPLASIVRAPSVELEVPRVGGICWFVLVVACRCESGPGSCQEAR
jgi:hypothetical protein